MARGVFPRNFIPNEIRFWNFVQTSDDCWIWTGHRMRQGYGTLKVRQSQGIFKTVKAHRFAYELIIGPIPEGKGLDHIECNNPSCVNPGHLVPATWRENILRGNGICGLNARKVKCKRGHLFDEKNTYFSIKKRGPSRECRICRRELQRNWIQKQRESVGR